jgi:cytochrome bd ubiquinol oxidase subunit I
MRTSQAVTPVPNLTIPLYTFTLLYLFLAFIVVFLLLRQFRQGPRVVRDQAGANHPPTGAPYAR